MSFKYDHQIYERERQGNMVLSNTFMVDENRNEKLFIKAIKILDFAIILGLQNKHG